MTLRSKSSASARREAQTRGERHRLRISARVAINGSGAFECLVHDISTKGMLIETDADLQGGDLVVVTLPADGQRIPPAYVVWSSGPFFGCGFLEAAPEELVREVLARDAASADARELGDEDGLGDAATQIVRVRQTLGLTAEEFAARIGVSRQAVWYWETGQRTPRPEQMRRIRRLAAPDGTVEEEPAAEAATIEQQVLQCKRKVARIVGVDEERVRITIDW